MCSTWLPTVFGAITRMSAISLFERPRATRRSTSTSRAVRPAGPPRRRATLWPAGPAAPPRAPGPGGAEPRLHRLGVEAAGLDLAAELRRRLVSRTGRTVRPWLAHRLVGVGCAQQQPRSGDRAAREPARVTRSV